MNLNPADGNREGLLPLMSPVAALLRSAPARGFLDVAHEAAASARYGFKVGDLGMVLDARTLCEVAAVPAAARIPGTPDWLLGVMNWRGTLVPVFDLHALLELPPNDRARDRVGLIIDSGEHAVATVIDGYPAPLRSLTALAELPPLPLAVKAHAKAAWRENRNVWIDLDHRTFFASLAARLQPPDGASGPAL